MLSHPLQDARRILQFRRRYCTCAQVLFPFFCHPCTLCRSFACERLFFMGWHWLFEKKGLFSCQILHYRRLLWTLSSAQAHTPITLALPITLWVRLIRAAPRWADRDHWQGKFRSAIGKPQCKRRLFYFSFDFCRNWLGSPCLRGCCFIVYGILSVSISADP